MQSTGKPADFKILCASPGVAIISFPHFATISGKKYSTNQFDLALSGAVLQKMMADNNYPFDMRADVIIVFPDGYSVEQKGVTRIDAVSHTISNQQMTPPAAPYASCKEDKQLLLSGIIPAEAEPVVAVAAGVAITALGLTAFGSAFFGMALKTPRLCAERIRSGTTGPAF
jgi:hypothetical protein